VVTVRVVGVPSFALLAVCRLILIRPAAVALVSIARDLVSVAVKFVWIAARVARAWAAIGFAAVRLGVAVVLYATRVISRSVIRVGGAVDLQLSRLGVVIGFAVTVVIKFAHEGLDRATDHIFGMTEAVSFKEIEGLDPVVARRAR